MSGHQETPVGTMPGASQSLPIAGTLTAYIRAALGRAQFEQIEDEPAYFGDIPGLQGVWGKGPTVEACRIELQSTLEDWLLFGLVNGLPVPPIDGLELHAERLA